MFDDDEPVAAPLGIKVCGQFQLYTVPEEGGYFVKDDAGNLHPFSIDASTTDFRDGPCPGCPVVGVTEGSASSIATRCIGGHFITVGHAEGDDIHSHPANRGER